MPFYDLSEMPSPELFPGWHGKVIHSERMTFVRWSVPAGAVLPNHSHPHEQLAHLISGEFELTIGGETRRIRSGSVAVIPPNAEHSGIAITACEFTDSFCPIREDYRK